MRDADVKAKKLRLKILKYTAALIIGAAMYLFIDDLSTVDKCVELTDGSGRIGKVIDFQGIHQVRMYDTGRVELFERKEIAVIECLGVSHD